MKTFWVILISICALFVGCSIYSQCKGYNNVIEWVQDWSLFDKEEKEKTAEDKVVDDTIDSSLEEDGEEVPS